MNGSFVDLTTNRMLVRDFRLRDYIGWLESRKLQPDLLLANFLHEWTHRWCFDSRTGAAIAALQLDAAFSQLIERRSEDAHVRSRAATTLLQPFAEGLALFAEFDAYPGKSDFMSQTLSTSLTLFAPVVAQRSGEEMDIYKRIEMLQMLLMQQLRWTPEMVERKANVLAMRADDPYFMGYAAVKALFAHLAAKCDALNDCDLFLSYLRSYIYDDPGFALLCLQEAQNGDELRAAEAMLNYQMARMDRLIRDTALAEKVQLWVDTASTGQADLSAIDADMKDDEALDDLMNKRIGEIFQSNENFGSAMKMVIQERRICIVGRQQVVLERDGDSLKVRDIDDHRVLFTLPDDDFKAEETSEVVAVAPNGPMGLVFLLKSGQSVKGLSEFGKIASDDLELVKRKIANLDLIDSVLGDARKLLDNDKTSQLLWELVDKRLSAALDALYGPLVTLHSPCEVHAETWETLRASSLYDFMGQDSELTRAYAAIGLMNCSINQVELIRAYASKLDLDPQALDRAFDLGAPKGLKLMSLREESAIALI